MAMISAACLAQAPDWWVDIANDRAQNVQRMLDEGTDPNAINDDGQPALMLAIREGAWSVYEVLLRHPKTVYNAINRFRETPLMYLAVIGETERAEDLIRRGALVNRPGWTPLHYAASTAKMDTARMLLRHGAHVNALAADGTSPLMMAAYSGSEAMVRLLLEAGADSALETRQGFDAADWAGFKAHTRLAGKLRALIDGDASQQAAWSAEGDAQGPAESLDGDRREGATASSTSRYFDLERFERDESP